MGAIKKVIDSFDSSSELGQVQRELVETLSNFAESKAKLFQAEIEESLRTAGDGNNKTIPINAIVRHKVWVHAYSSKSAGSISETVSEALNSFVSGTTEGILSGISGLISKALTMFLGEASASTGTVKEYYVMTEGLSIVRVDMMAWYLNVASSSIYDQMQRVCSFVGVKSTVDLSQIDFNTFLYLYQDQLSAAGLDASDLKKAIDTAKEIYADYRKAVGESNKPKVLVNVPPALSHLTP